MLHGSCLAVNSFGSLSRCAPIKIPHTVPIDAIETSTVGVERDSDDTVGPTFSNRILLYIQVSLQMQQKDLGTAL